MVRIVTHFYANKETVIGEPISASVTEAEHFVKTQNNEFLGIARHWIVDDCNETIVIPITRGQPVSLDTAKWPVVARGDASDVLAAGTLAGCAIRVRRHVDDGRIVAEAALTIEGMEDLVVGWFSGQYDPDAPDLLLIAIRTVALYLGESYGERPPRIIYRAAESAYASLPTVELS